MSGLTGGQRYTDAFWFVVPIPLLVAGATVGVILQPSGPAVAAVIALAIVAACLEAVLCLRLRASWERGERLSEREVARPIILTISSAACSPSACSGAGKSTACRGELPPSSRQRRLASSPPSTSSSDWCSGLKGGAAMVDGDGVSATPATPRLGGQAIIEGVMVRAGDRWAAAARKPDGTITTTQATVPPWTTKARRVPVVRGTLALGATVTLGMRALSWSREVADNGKPASRAQAATGALMSVAVFVAVFALGPAALARALAGRSRGPAFVIAEAAIRLALFVGYVAAIGRLPGIRRTFEYHGAEHQAIAAAEAGDPLDHDHVNRYSPRHARCGTDFLVLVAVVAVVVFSLVSPAGWLALAASRVLLLPVVAGLAYEVLRVSDRPGAARWLKPVMAPGLAVQRLTTRQPSADQVEVAIAAVNAALAPTQTAT